MKILVITPFNEREWTWFGDTFSGHQWTFKNLSLFGKRPWHWLSESIHALKSHTGHDIIVTHHPYMAFYFCIAMRIFGVQKPIYAFSFNHGNGRFFKGFSKRIAIWAFKLLKGVAVFSEKERHIYSQYYDIPIQLFSFHHWTARAPEINKDLYPYLSKLSPYICSIGRNNRDFESVIDAANTIGCNLIIVCKNGAIPNSRIYNNVTVRCDIDSEEAMAILGGSKLSVTLLKDCSTGAGHMTLVSAMQLGVPQITSKIATVDDYFIDGLHGYTVEAGNTENLADKIASILKENQDGYAKRAKEFSDAWLSERAAQDFLTHYMQAIVDSAPPPKAPLGWHR